MKGWHLLAGVCATFLTSCAFQEPTRDGQSAPEPASAGPATLDPVQYAVVPLKPDKSNHDQKLTLKRAPTAANGGKYDVLWGPYTLAEAEITPDEQDLMGGGEAAFVLNSGFAFTFRPLTWPLGQTRRIGGGTVGVALACPHPTGDVFTAYYCDPGKKIDRLYIIAASASACNDCEFVVVLHPTSGQTKTRSVKVGQYVEIVDETINEPASIVGSPDAMALMNYIKAKADVFGIDYMAPH